MIIPSEETMMHASTWGSRVIFQESVSSISILGYKLDGHFVLADALSACANKRQKDEIEEGLVICGGGDSWRVYSTLETAWENEIHLHMASLGSIPDLGTLFYHGGIRICFIFVAATLILLLLPFANKLKRSVTTCEKSSVDQSVYAIAF